MNTTKNAAVYTRVSDSKQDTKEYGSLEVQLDRLQGYVSSNRAKGWVFYKNYRESGKTGTNAEREELQAMLADAKQGLFQVLVFVDTDRLARNVDIFRDTIRQLEDLGIEIHSLQNGRITRNDANGWLQANLKASYDEYYSRDLAAKVMRGARARARTGLKAGGFANFGYCYPEGEGRHLMVPEPTGAKLVVEMFHLIASGVSSFDAVFELNSQLLEMGANSRGHFKTDKIASWIRNPIYKGWVRARIDEVTRHDSPALFQEGNYEYYRGQHAPLVSEALWQRANEALDQRRASRIRVRRSTKQQKAPYLLQGLVGCDCCNATMISTYAYNTEKRTYPYYQCVNKATGRDLVTCNVVRISAGTLDTIVCDFCGEIARRPHIVEAALGALKNGAGKITKRGNADLKNAEKALSQVKHEIGNCVHVLSAGGLGAVNDELKSRVASLKEQEVRLVKEIENHKWSFNPSSGKGIDAGYVAGAFANFHALLSHLSVEKQKVLVRALVRRVAVSRISEPRKEWVEVAGPAAAFWRLKLKLSLPKLDGGLRLLQSPMESAKEAATINYDVTVAVPRTRNGIRYQMLQPIEFEGGDTCPKPDQSKSVEPSHERHSMLIALDWEKRMARNPLLRQVDMARETGMTRQNASAIMKLLELPRAIKQVFVSGASPVVLRRFSGRNLRMLASMPQEEAIDKFEAELKAMHLALPKKVWKKRREKAPPPNVVKRAFALQQERARHKNWTNVEFASHCKLSVTCLYFYSRVLGLEPTILRKLADCEDHRLLRAFTLKVLKKLYRMPPHKQLEKFHAIWSSAVGEA